MLQNDLEWGLSVSERNLASGRKLLEVLATKDVSPAFICDIGCGIGTWLRAARTLGIGGVGFDVNHVATAYGRDEYDLDLRCAFWDSTVALPAKPGLYTCIMVCEHIERPRPLIRDLCSAARRDGAAIFISVPVFNSISWPDLLDPAPTKPGTIFADNDVHVTHFSQDGLIRCLTEFGATSVQMMLGGIWYGALAKF